MSSKNKIRGIMRHDNIKKIADMLSDDPDEIVEMSLTTGAFPGGPFVEDGFTKKIKRRKKKKKKSSSKKKPKVNASGQPTEQGKEVLYSNLEVDRHLKEEGGAEESARSQRAARKKTKEAQTRAKEKEKENKIKEYKRFLIKTADNPPSTPNSDLVFDGGIDFLTQNEIPDSTEMSRINKVATQVNSVLATSWKALRDVRAALWNLHNDRLTSSENCEFIQQFNILNDSKNDWKRALNSDGPFSSGIAMPPPTKGWQGIHDWSSQLEKSKYLTNYVFQIAYRFHKKVNDSYSEHVASCEDQECHGDNHVKYLLNGYCEGFTLNGKKVNLNTVIAEVSQERIGAIQDFKAAKRKAKNKNVMPQISDADKKRHEDAREKYKRDGIAFDMHDVFRDYYKKLYRIKNKNETADESETIERNELTIEELIPKSGTSITESIEWNPLSISNLLTEDPDVMT